MHLLEPNGASQQKLNQGIAAGNPILFKVFKKKYLTNSIIQDSFYNSAHDIFLEIKGDEEFDYVLVLNEVGRLKMLISI